LGKVTKTTLKPLRIEGNRLSSFMEAYLTQRGKRDRFTHTEFFDACSRLSTMVGTRNITVLLAKLYAEQLIGASHFCKNTVGGGFGDLGAFRDQAFSPFFKFADWGCSLKI
jgi:hypothetical protein